MSGSLRVAIQGQTLLLHPERAATWVERNTLIVADTHFGKSALFRRQGLAVPAGSDENDRNRLSSLVRATAARRLIVLGDFLHGPLEADSDDARNLEQWAAQLSGTEIVVVAGNHDRGAARRWLPPGRWHHGDLREPPFVFTHDADTLPCGQQLYALSGHVHPVTRIGGLRRPGLRVPIFWQRPGGLVLPSFGIFTGGYAVRPRDGDHVFAVGPQRVVQFR